MKLTNESQILLEYLKKDIDYIKPKKKCSKFFIFYL